jgi:hypothetical protein
VRRGTDRSEGLSKHTLSPPMIGGSAVFGSLNFSSSKPPSTSSSFGPFRLGKTIGQGEFGKVRLGYHLQDNQEVLSQTQPIKPNNKTQ